MFLTLTNAMGDKLNKFAGYFPIFSNIIACILTLGALLTTSWFLKDGWNYGLFQKCLVDEDARRRECTRLIGKFQFDKEEDTICSDLINTAISDQIDKYFWKLDKIV